MTWQRRVNIATGILCLFWIYTAVVVFPLLQRIDSRSALYRLCSDVSFDLRTQQLTTPPPTAPMLSECNFVFRNDDVDPFLYFVALGILLPLLLYSVVYTFVSLINRAALKRRNEHR